jgi:multicomponent K+:H+ antiporter subunit A
MKTPVEVLVALCLLVGIVPALTVGPLLAIAAGAVVGGELPAYSLALWHGFNLPLAMSALALAGGVLVYSQRRRLFRLHDEVLPALSASAVYAALLGALLRTAGAVTGWLENGSLQRYLVFFLIAALAAGVIPFWRWEWGLGPEPLTPVDGVSLVAWAVLAAAALGTAVWHRRRFTALILLSVVGLIVALAFVRFSAPDLALTQLSVEMVTIVLLLLALYFLPQRSPAESTSARRARDVVLAAAAGLGVFALVLAVLTRPLDSISRFHLEHSVPGGGGTNVVNVILVDFRGYDTLGEIVVLAIAALAIYALLDGVRIPPRPLAEDGTLWARDRYPLMLAVLTRPLLPLALLVSFYLLLRGHNQPGGGFIAGLVTAIALIMQYLASGIHWARERLRLDYHPVIALGLLTAAFTGIASWLFGAPFLTSTFGYVHLPWIGGVKLASAMLFDLGVYFTVVGAVMLIFANLGRVSGGEAEAVAAAEEAGWKS